MSDITFIPGTVIPSTWLNDINDVVYGTLGSAALVPPTTKPEVLINLGLYLSATSYGITTTNTAAVNAAALLSMIQSVPAGSNIYFPPGDYPITSVDATPLGHLTIWGYGARLINTTQIAVNGVPILRLRGSATTDFGVFGLSVLGPRLTSSNTVGSGTYSGTGMPSGIDFYTARNITVRDVKSTGTYYSGVEAHFYTKFILEHCDIQNHGYSGTTFSDGTYTLINGNYVNDIGSVMITDGWGINSATTYQVSTIGYNEQVVITNNRVTNCKRKCIDCHSGLEITITNNYVRGFGYSGIYAICEELSKQVRDVVISNNIIYGDVAFVASASNAGIDIGNFGPSVSQQGSFTISDNAVYSLVCNAIIFVANNTTVVEKDTRFISITGNKGVDVAATQGIFFNNNTPGKNQEVRIVGNLFNNCPFSVGYITAPYCNTLIVRENAIVGSLNITTIIYTQASTTIIERNLINGVLQGAAQLEVYSSGLRFESTLTFGGSVSNLDILTCDLGAASDTSVAVEVLVSETRNSNNGYIIYALNVYGTRAGVAAAVFNPIAATNMGIQTTVYGAATAPKLIWTVVGNIGTLQFQPQDTFANYIIQVRASSWRGTLTALVR